MIREKVDALMEDRWLGKKLHEEGKQEESILWEKRAFSHFSLGFSLCQLFYAKLKSNHFDAQELKQTDFESKSISLVENFVPIITKQIDSEICLHSQFLIFMLN